MLVYVSVSTPALPALDNRGNLTTAWRRYVDAQIERIEVSYIVAARRCRQRIDDLVQEMTTEQVNKLLETAEMWESLDPSATCHAASVDQLVAWKVIQLEGLRIGPKRNARIQTVRSAVIKYVEWRRQQE